MVNKVALSLSTVIISKNDLSGLIKTLNSFNNLGDELPKIILVLSEFKTEDVEMLRKKFAFLALEVHTLPAEGPYAAMNHGLAKVKTKYVNFLNSGDSLAPNTMLTTLLSSMNNSLIGYGDIEICDDFLGETTRYSFRPYYKYLHRLGIKYIPHPATIVSVEAAKKLGGFDLNYPVSADQKLALMLTKTTKPAISNGLISKFKRGGLSTRSPIEIVEDFHNISNDLYGYVGRNFIVDYLFWKLILLIRSIHFFVLKHR
jgi:glycosyltransferase involved in cell wall biosynthesis